MKLIEKCKYFFNYIFGALSVNLGWKIFSLVFAVCVWFVVINITNPKEIWPFTINLTLTGVENLSEYHTVVVRNQTALESTPVHVKIRGNRMDLEELNKYRGTITASANLGVIYDFTLNGEVQAPIDVIFPYIPGVSPDAFEVISISPKYAGVVLEEIITEEKTVKVNMVGEVAEGYVALTPEVTPETVKLRGPRSKLNQIDQVLVETVLSGETEDISVSLSPKLLDKDMNEVQDVDCFTELVDININIDKFKRVPVHAAYVGEPMEGYAVTDITWEPTELEIVGSGSDVNEFMEVTLAAVNISGITETNITSRDIRSLNILPEGVSIKNGTPNTVTVTVTIEQIIDKTFMIPVSMLSTGTLSPLYSYNVLDSELEITLRGVETIVNEIRDDSVKLSVDLSGYEEGSHSVPVKTELPEGIELAGDSPAVRVNIERTAQNAEEAEDEETALETAPQQGNGQGQ